MKQFGFEIKSVENESRGARTVIKQIRAGTSLMASVVMLLSSCYSC